MSTHNEKLQQSQKYFDAIKKMGQTAGFKEVIVVFVEEVENDRSRLGMIAAGEEDNQIPVMEAMKKAIAQFIKQLQQEKGTGEIFELGIGKGVNTNEKQNPN